MNRIAQDLKSRENKIKLEENLFTSSDSRMAVKNVSIYWDSVSIISGVNDTFVVDKKTVTIPQGYWGFAMLQGIFRKKGITLIANEWNNTCSIQTQDKLLSLIKLGLLLGFTDDYTVQANTKATSSSQVEINNYLRFVTIGCNIVDQSKNFGIDWKRSNVVCVLPITSQQNLICTVTHFGNRDCLVPLYNGTFNELVFYVDTNIPQKVGMTVLLEAEII